MRVTAFALRKAVGGGNPARLMQVWEGSGDQTPKPAEAVGSVELPMEVEDAMAKLLEASNNELIGLVKQIYSMTHKASERRVTEMFREAGHMKDNAARDVEEATRQVVELDGELEAAREELQARKTAADKFAELDAERTAEIATLRERLAGATESVSQLKTELQMARERAENAERAADAARHEATSIAGRYEALQEVQKQLNASIAAAKSVGRKPAAKRAKPKKAATATAATPPR